MKHDVPSWNVALERSVVTSAVCGVTVGVAEACWVGRGLTEALLWAWVIGLYGALAVAFGILPSLAGGLRWVRQRAAGLGLVMGGGPLGLFVLLYVLNRDVFAEAMPTWAKALCVVMLGLMAAGILIRPWSMGRVVGRVVLGGIGMVFLVMCVVAWSQPPVAPWPGTAGARATQQDGVVFILVDTLRADVADDSSVDTPNLDALRADGVSFVNAFSSSSWTRPGVASLWTSMHPSAHSAQTKSSRLPEAVDTWAERFAGAQFRTGALVNNVNVTATYGFDQGFDDFVYLPPDYPLGATDAVFGLAMYKVLHRLEERVRPGSVSRYYQPAPKVLDLARAWIEERGAARWALSVHLMEPHDPYFDESGNGYARAKNPQPAESEREELLRRYKGEVEAMDRALGPFIEWLKESGRYDRTTIVLTSDHGEEFYEHGGWWHGTALYGESTHVPLIIKLPEQELASKRVPWSVRTIDVVPTLASLYDVESSPRWQGENLLSPAAREAIGADSIGSEVQQASTCMAERGSPLDRPVVLELDFEGNQVAGTIAHGLSYYRAEPGGSRVLPAQSLFDLLVDPEEQRNAFTTGEGICAKFPEDWGSEFDSVLRAVSNSGEGVDEETVTTDDAERQRLCALGYLKCD